MKAIPLLFLSIVIFLVDFFSKAYVHTHMPYAAEGVSVFQGWCGIDFSLTHLANKGAAWGAFASFEKYLLALRILVIAAMVTYLFFFNRKREQRLPFALILTGAIGNVVDSFLYGHVIDMFHFTFWGYSYPVFNVADSTIFCGIVLLIFQSLRARHRERKAI